MKDPFLFPTLGLDDVSPELGKKDNLSIIKNNNPKGKKKFDTRIMDTEIKGGPKSPVSLSKNWYK